MADTLLIDVGPLSCCGTDHVLDEMHKALSEGDGEDIWRVHESVFVRQLVEDITGRGRGALDALSSDLIAWLEKKAQGVAAVVPTPAELVAWAPEKAAKVFQYLAGKPMATWSASDYMLLVDYLVHAHFPAEFPRQVSELAVKQSAVMGRVQSVAESITEAQAFALLHHFTLAGETEQALSLAQINRAVIEYGEVHCAQNIQAFTDSVRARIKRVVLEHEKAIRLEGRQPPHSLQTKLFDQFAEFNRDWRRIALTEPGEMANQGFVSALKPGEKVKRLEQYRGACAFCRKIDGRIATVVSPDKKDKDWDNEIWPGKDNVGRSASPYKRVGGQLVKRLDAEMWKLPAGLAHPHCRGTWIRVTGPAASDEFTGWLFDFLKKKPEPATS